MNNKKGILSILLITGIIVNCQAAQGEKAQIKSATNAFVNAQPKSDIAIWKNGGDDIAVTIRGNIAKMQPTSAAFAALASNVTTVSILTGTTTAVGTVTGLLTGTSAISNTNTKEIIGLTGAITGAILGGTSIILGITTISPTRNYLNRSSFALNKWSKARNSLSPEKLKRSYVIFRNRIAFIERKYTHSKAFLKGSEGKGGKSRTVVNGANFELVQLPLK